MLAPFSHSLTLFLSRSSSSCSFMELCVCQLPLRCVCPIQAVFQTDVWNTVSREQPAKTVRLAAAACASTRESRVGTCHLVTKHCPCRCPLQPETSQVHCLVAGITALPAHAVQQDCSVMPRVDIARGDCSPSDPALHMTLPCSRMVSAPVNFSAPRCQHN